MPLVGYAAVYSLQGEARERPQHFQIDALIHHYDPVWHQLWAQDGEDTFFLIPPPGTLPIHPGQLVRLSGTTTPANFSKVSSLSALVLDEHPVTAPLPTAGRLDDVIHLNEHLVEIAGYVESQMLLDPNHLRCVLIAEGIRIETIVWLETDSMIPALAGALIRAQGVYSGRLYPDGRLQSIAFGVPSPGQIEITGSIRDDPRFTGSVTAIEQLPGANPSELIHVAGRIVSIYSGHSITIRDATGQLELLTPQDTGLQPGNELEAIGYPAIAVGVWQLRQALVRHGRPLVGNASTSSQSILRLAGQVLALPMEKAEAGQPVLLQGVVTWSAPGTKFIYLQDPSGGVRIDWNDPSIAVPEIGAGLAVDGVSSMGAFAPAVAATRLSSRYEMSPPEPLRLSLDEAETGIHEAQWVEMSGLLREIRPDGRNTQLSITTPTGDFEVLTPSDDRFAGMLGSFVRLRGICTALTNEHRQLTGIRLRMPGAAHIGVEEAPPGDLFAMPENAIASLRQFGPLQGFTHWLRTSGIVTYYVPGGYLVIQDDSEALTVFPVNELQLQVGDRVDVVGSPGRDGPRLVLRNAHVRSLGVNAHIQPVSLADPSLLDDRFDTRLVRFAGSLDEVTELGNERFLEIRHGSGAILARLRTAATPIPATWRKGSEVELTGIYRLIFDEHRRRTGFDLLLRSPADVHILRPAPWWTSERTRSAAAILGLCVAGGFLWVVLLRRKVHQQTVQLRAQLDKEAHLEAELERAQRLHSLGTLAGGIAHDFNNLLTVIMGNVTLAMLDKKVMALAGDCLKEAEAGAQRARELTQQLLTFARGGDPIREDFALPPLVHETSVLALSGANVRAEIQAQPDLHPVHADRAQIHRALHNLLAHANLSMPDGGIVSIDLADETIGSGHPSPLAPGLYVRIRISDHGEAIPADRLPSIFDPYAATGEGGERFGLATAYSIAHKHGGHLSAQSSQGRGTTFTLWLHASDTATAPSAATQTSAPTLADTGPSVPEAATAGARVLFMDDEEGIRLLAEQLLRQLQCEPVLVTNGAECIAAYRAAMAEGRPFDLVVMDLSISGGMGGREAIGELRKIDPLVRAIVSSGYSNDPTLAHYREHGFIAVVPKPYEADQLTAAIARALASRPDL